MPAVRVYNDNIFDHKEKFRDEWIHIPAGKCVEMEYDDAHLFLGQYFPIIKDAGGAQIPQSYKMLRIVEGPIPHVKEVDPLTCQACNETFGNKEALNKHVDDKHVEQLADKEEKEKREKAIAAKDKK